MKVKTKNLIIVSSYTSYVLLLTFLFIISIPNVHADIISRGYHGIEHCFQVSNLNEYPEYTFISRSFITNIAESVWVNEFLDNNACTKFHRGIQKLQICATKDKINVQELTDANLQDKACSNVLDIKFAGIVRNSNPTQRVVDVLSIDEITDTSLDIKKFKVIYTYDSGKVEELPYTNQDIRPAVPIPSVIFAGRMWIVLSIGALLAIIFIIIWKFIKRKNE